MLVHVVDCGTCPDGSIQNEDSSICYWFNHDKKYYEESEIQCKKDAQSHNHEESGHPGIYEKFDHRVSFYFNIKLLKTYCQIYTFVLF